MKYELPIRIALGVSGGGTTALHNYNACQPGEILHGLIEPVCLIASNPNAGAIDKLTQAGMPEDHIHVCCKKDYQGDEDAWGDKIIEIFKQEGVQLWGQYGWMPKTPSKVIEYCPGINQHPALTPDVGGKGMHGIWPHRAMIELLRRTGRDHMFTHPVAQLVDVEYDKGGIIFCLAVPVYRDNTAEELQQRVLLVEWAVQKMALALVANAMSEGQPILTIKKQYFSSEDIALLDEIKLDIRRQQGMED